MNLEFCSLSSGSSGNCYYLGNGFHGILIDAGISGTSIRKSLQKLGISIQSIMGVLVTHNHSDHTQGLYQLTMRNKIPAFATPKNRKSILSPKIKISGDAIHEIGMQQKFHLAGFEIEAFPVFHDAPETVGFHICAGDKKVTIVTDLGHICDTAAPYIKAANLLVIESNYDEQMLEQGSYPQYLKDRIQSDKGHLSNLQTSTFLADNINENMIHICLAHLSLNNNTPEKALQTLQQTFQQRSISLNGHLQISVLNRNTSSELIRFF